MVDEQELYFQGSVLSRGIAIGSPYFLGENQDPITEIPISSQEIEHEVKRYRRALRESRQYLFRLKNKVEREGTQESVSVLESHLQMIEDPMLNDHMEEEIRSTSKNAEFVLKKAIERFEKKFLSIDDPFFQQRFEDVQDISKRILDSLQKRSKAHFAYVPQNSIIFAHTIAPSDVAEAKTNNIAAFVTEIGGALSHSAIIAKARGIPFVTDIHFCRVLAQTKPKCVIVDGLAGKVIVNPTKETLTTYTKLKNEIQSQYALLKKTLDLPSITQEGDPIRLYASIDSVEDFSLLANSGAQGVGLFRTEYLVLQNGRFPSEEEQFDVYRSLAQKMGNSPIVIRAFDIGLDKIVSHGELASIFNSQLKERAIRFLLKESEIFKMQLRALLRASCYGDIKLLLPMISSNHELEHAKQLMQQAYLELINQGYRIPKLLDIGCMIEVPSAALICDTLARNSHFLSIGTNDLIQFTLAVDRVSQHTNPYFASVHPGFLRLVKMIIHEAQERNVPVHICGEMASDPRFTALLIGLGAKGLSAPLRMLPVIKHVIRTTSRKEAKQLVDTLLSFKAPKDAQEVLFEYYQKNLPSGIQQNF